MKSAAVLDVDSIVAKTINGQGWLRNVQPIDYYILYSITYNVTSKEYIAGNV